MKLLIYVIFTFGLLVGCAKEEYDLSASFPRTEKDSTFNRQMSHDPRIQTVHIGNKMRLVLSNDDIFVAHSKIIQPDAYALLNRVSSILRHYPKTPITIATYTDNTPSAKQQQIVSKQRAENLRAYFWAHDINKDQLHIAAMGDQTPVANNHSINGRRYNRRTEITFNLK